MRVKSILLLEDEPGLAEMLVLILEREQFRVVAVANGVEALAALEEEKADVILTDVMMPLMTGPEFCRAVRADPAFVDIPIVFQTSVEEWAVREHFGDFDAFFLKPYEMSRLLERLKSLAENGRAASDVSPGRAAPQADPVSDETDLGLAPDLPPTGDAGPA